jgi:hypothetical protein
MMSSELDILIVGYNEERFSTEIRQAFRHWQVYTCSAPHALYQRRFRHAYYTDGVLTHRYGGGILDYLRGSVDGGEVRPFSEYRPVYDVQSFADAQLLRSIRRSRHPAN